MRDQTQGSFHSEPACYLLFEDGMFISDAEYALKKYLEHFKSSYKCFQTILFRSSLIL